LSSERRASVKPKEIGATVRAIRSELGMTTTVLGQKIGVSQAQISRLENGYQGFRSETLGKMAVALKVPVFRFMMTAKEWERWKRLK